MKPVAILILALTVFDIRMCRRRIFLAQFPLTAERHAAQDVHAVLVIAKVRDSEDEDQNDFYSQLSIPIKWELGREGR